MQRRGTIMGSIIGPPDTYDAEVEYIQLTGEQYIKLPIKPDESTDAVEIALFRTAEQNGNYLWCTEQLESCFKCHTDGNSQLVYYNDAGQKKNVYGTREPGVGRIYHIIKYDYKNGKVIIDGAQYGIPLLTKKSNYYFTLLRQNGTFTSTTQRLYSCKYWRNEVLMFDLVPVRKNGIGYMYDKIHKKLYGNAGTGDFIIGYDKLTNLSDYTLLNYIYQNDRNFLPRGSIYTGIVSRPDKIKIELDIMKTKSISGNHGTNSGPKVGWNSSNVFTDNCGNLSGTTASNNIRYTITMDDYQDTDVSKPSSIAVIYLMGLAQTGNTRAVYHASDAVCAKLYGAKIWVNDILERDYVPVQHPAGQRGLFDKIYNKFYPSCTTYNFLGA